MSTILDALRKAQEDASGKRQQPVGEHPAANEALPPARLARRRVRLPIAIAGILAVAFAGGLAVGDRIVALFGGGPAAPAPGPDVQAVASRVDDVAVTGEQVGAPEPAPALAEAASPTPAVRRGRRPARGGGEAPATRFEQTVDTVMDRTKPGPEAAPTPYGQLHVFGAGERPAAGKPAVEERLARLQQLREKMQKARQDAAARAPDAASEPTQVLVPPPRAPAPAEDAGGAAAVAGRSRPSESPPATTGVQTGFADEGGSRERVPSAAGAAPPAPAPQGARIDAAVPNETAVGVSVANAQGEAEGAQLRDPAAMLPADVPATDPEPPQAVAAIEPPASAPATVPAQAPATSPPVLRRAPGGAPQVAINILQWSAEPARRFAFVSVDGGNVTQVREGDHIGGLTIKHIHQQMIEFGFNDSTFLLRAN